MPALSPAEEELPLEEPLEPRAGTALAPSADVRRRGIAQGGTTVKNGAVEIRTHAVVVKLAGSSSL